MYGGPFAEEIEDPYLRRAALESLKRAGDEQGGLYDFSFSERNLKGAARGRAISRSWSA
jgi:N-acetylmuramic acid 6-phosphate etherase